MLSGLLWQGRRAGSSSWAGSAPSRSARSLALLAELAEVIGRPRFTQRIQAAGVSAIDLVQDYARLAVSVEPQPLPEPVSRDPDDDAVLAAAVTR